MLRKSDQFRGIEEWQPLRLDGVWPLLFVGQVLLAAALLARRRSWRVALPLVLFTGLALMSSRNVAVASLVLLPGMAVGAAGIGAVDGLRRSRAALGIVAVCVVAGCVLGVSALTGPDTQLRPYPEQAVTWLEEHDRIDDRLIAPDYVGNYLEARYGARRAVFIDDRVDMYPAAVVDDSLVLLRAEPGWQDGPRPLRAGRDPLAQGQAPHPAAASQRRLAARLRRRRLGRLRTGLTLRSPPGGAAHERIERRIGEAESEYRGTSARV